ncbi:exonuclease SbcCD subunit D [Lentibacillus amyloliquefaciens]|uniref:Nuclease SbcCD subunit D n=1 Tax=Lentibacillus amyloliquefaciens TaxID=1472767 RepID=A0A0U3W5W6_9BACI|nr:exonuclease SbcCD subunit D [Lentibacillus amyloliquefaciens]ALX48578.1 exonuclease sbcCD subunit D [Lentibacillus amyloliquefaciens]
MKLFHTADWHLGKLVQGVYMTDDQRYCLDQFAAAVEEERPDAVIIAGDLYDRAVPPTEAVNLLDETLSKIVLELKTPVLAVAGNHDSPGRLDFGSNIMKQNGFYIAGHFDQELKPVVLYDEHGPVHFHLVPYCDPSVVRTMTEDDTVRSHNDAGRKIAEMIQQDMDPDARHVYIGHAFVTPFGEEEENTSDSERPLSIGGAEYVDARHFAPFDYTALGHLHHAHHVTSETVRYSGSILKYSISEEHHQKGYSVVELGANGEASIEKRTLTPKRDIRTVEATMDELLTHPVSDDYVFVRLLDEAPVLSPMERLRSVYPNAMHVERGNFRVSPDETEVTNRTKRTEMSDLDLFRNFYKEVKGYDVSEDTEAIFNDVLDDLLKEEREAGPSKETVKN